MNEPSAACHPGRATVSVIPEGGVIKGAWRALEDVGRLLPRSVINAPIGGRLPIVRPAISPGRLAGAVRDKHVLVTGATSGIGLETAQAIARAGGALTLVARNEERLADVAAQVRGLGGHAEIVPADLSGAADADRVVETVLERSGGVDLLVNNAGIENQVPLLEMGLEDWERVLRTNLTGAFLCLREAGNAMVRAGGGVVVNMSSVHEFIPWPGFAHYCATKGAMKLLMQTAARELADKRIRVLNVAPGAIVTPINQFVLDDPEEKHAVESEIPLARMGQPEEIAAAVAWAASDQAGYVTGTTLVVDGGMSLYPKFV
jgi:glucose 1-dehydrogenase